MKMYFRYGEGYYTFVTPMINETGDNFIRQQKVILKRHRSMDELSADIIKHYLVKNDFVIVFGFPLEHRYVTQLDCSYGNITLPKPKNYTLSTDHDDKILWNLKYFFSFYFRIIVRGFSITVQGQELELDYLRNLLEDMPHKILYSKNYQCLMILYQLYKKEKEASLKHDKLYQYLLMKHTTLKYNEDNLE